MTGFSLLSGCGAVGMKLSGSHLIENKSKNVGWSVSFWCNNFWKCSPDSIDFLATFPQRFALQFIILFTIRKHEFYATLN